MKYFVYGCFVSIFAATVLSAANAPVQPLTALSRSEGWNARAGKVTLRTVDNGVEAILSPAASTFTLDCAAPVLLEATRGRVGFWFYAKTLKTGEVLDVRFRLRDVEGKPYEYNTGHDAWSSIKINSGGWTFVESYPLDARDGNAVAALAGSQLGGPKPSPLPKFPFSLQAVVITAPSGSMIERVQLSSPVFSQLDFRQSECYWQARDRSLAAEDTGLPDPFVLTSDYADRPGDYQLYWILTEARGGDVMATGTRSFTIGNDVIPTMDRIALPRLSPGSYHLRTRLWNKKEAASSYRETEDWLFIYRGGGITSKPAVFPSESDRIAIDPATPSGVHEPTTSLNLPIEVFTTGLPSEPCLLEWKILHFDGRPFDAGTIAFTPEAAGLFRGSIAFKPPGDDNVFQVEVALKQSGKKLDRNKRLIGFRGIAPQPIAYDPSAPGLQPSLFIGITAIGSKFRNDERYQRHLKALREKGIRGIEYHVEWSAIEPLPGCFTFAEMDRHLEMARREGLKIMLRLRSEFPRYTIPDWVTGDFLCQQDGRADGLISAGPVPSPCDTRWVNEYENYQQTVGRRYASNPWVISYKMPQNIREAYWIDRPFRYQFTDYSDAAANAFRSYLKDQYATLAAVAKKYGKQYASWEQIEPPQPYADTESLNLTPEWRDWSAFKNNFYNASLISRIEKLHAAAPRQHLYVYSINQLTGTPTSETLRRFPQCNASLATGGSLPIGEVSHTRLYVQGYGLTVIPEPNAYALRNALDADSHAGMALEGSAGKGPLFYSYWATAVEPGGTGSDFQAALNRMAQWNPVYESVPKLTMPQAPVGFVFSWTGMWFKQRAMYSQTFTEHKLDRYLAALRHNGVEAFGADDAFTLEMLQRFKVLVIPPETSPSMSAEQIRNIAQYARAGGVVVLTPDSGNIVLDSPEKKSALLAALGISEDNVTSSTQSYPVGKGTAWICPNGEGLNAYLGSEAFLDILRAAGGKRYFRAADNRVVATLHDGQDGAFYLYVYNPGSTNEVTLTAIEWPQKGMTFDLQDLINGTRLEVSGKPGTSFSIPMSKGKAGFVKITPKS